jgi:hypothetical protein
MKGRLEAALRAFADEAAAAAYAPRIERGTESRHAMLLELELLCGLDCPARAASAATRATASTVARPVSGGGERRSHSVGERLLAWCAQPGVTDARDRQRCERVFLAMEKARHD